MQTEFPDPQLNGMDQDLTLPFIIGRSLRFLCSLLMNDRPNQLDEHSKQEDGIGPGCKQGRQLLVVD